MTETSHDKPQVVRQGGRAQGSDDRAHLHHGGGAPLRRGDLGAARRRPAELEDRRDDLRAARGRVPRLLVGQRLDDRDDQVLPRRRRHRRPRDRPAPAHRPGGPHLRSRRPRARLLRERRRRRGVRARADLGAAAPGVLVQLPGLVQRRHVLPPAGLGLLHPRGRRHDGLDPELVPRGGPDLQGRLRCRPQPLAHPVVEGAAVLRRHRVRPGLVHARRRRVRRAPSSPAAPPGARRRWSCSTSTTPTSRSSSRPRRARRTRSARCATPGSTWTSAARTSPPCSTRTPTTRCASPTSSCARSRRAPSSA